MSHQAKQKKIGIKTNIYNTTVKEATDLKGKHCYVEKHITPYRKAGVWNQPQDYFNRYVSNPETIVKEYQFEQKSKPNEKYSNFADNQKNLDDYLDQILYRQVQEYYKDVPTAYDKAKRQVYEKEEKLKKLQMSKHGELLDEKTLKHIQEVKKRVRRQIMSLNISKQEKNRKNQAEIQRLYKTMKEAVSHILAGEGEQKFNRMTQQLHDKEHLNCEAFKERRANQDPKQAVQFYEDLRLLVSKRTDEFEILRQIHGDDFLTNTTMLKELSESGRSGDTGSVISDSMTKYESELEKQQQQDPKLAKLYDVEGLKHKWGYKTDKQVKDSIRRILVRETLSEAEHKKARQERLELEMREKMIKNDPSLAQLFKAEDKNKKKFWHDIKAKQSKREKEKEERRKRLFAKKDEEEDSDEEEEFARGGKIDSRTERKKFNPQQVYEKKVKNEFMQIATGGFISQGEVFARTKEYSQLFQRRAENNYQTLEFKESPDKLNEFIQATYT